MKIIELDLTGCQYLDELHERIRVAFGFSEDYGKNWNAFWDLLWSECDAEKVIIRGEHTLSAPFKKHLDMMHKCLDDNITFCNAHQEFCDYKGFSYEIMD